MPSLSSVIEVVLAVTIAIQCLVTVLKFLIEIKLVHFRRSDYYNNQLFCFVFFLHCLCSECNHNGRENCVGKL